MTFACTNCGSAAIVPPKNLDDDEQVTCRGCNKALFTWRDFKNLAEEVPNELVSCKALESAGGPWHYHGSVEAFSRPLRHSIAGRSETSAHV
jgi:hypothetical protein